MVPTDATVMVPGVDQPFGSHRATSAFGLETNRAGAPQTEVRVLESFGLKVSL